MTQAKRRLSLLAAIVITASTPLFASAEERSDVTTERREEPVRIQVGINMFFPGPTGESEEAAKLRERARRSVYEMAAGECSLVLQVLAKTCRLESVNVNLNRQPVAQTDGYTVSGNFTLRVTLK
jgi:hypothetical protein